MKYKKNKLPQGKRARLKDNHTWKAPHGYKIVVLDRGAVSFNIPESWVLAKLEQPIELYDKAPPDDNSRLSISVWRLPPGVDWSGLPLNHLLSQALQSPDHTILERGEIVLPKRDDLELAWTQHRFLDETEKREAYTRIAVARGFDIQILVTLDFWVDDLAKCDPVWSELLHSLQLGRRIDDPTRGVVLH